MDAISALLGTSGALGNLMAAKKTGIPIAATPSLVDTKASIDNAALLSQANKTKLDSLADTVNQYAPGNSKLLHDIAGIGTLLQLNGDPGNDAANSPIGLALQQFYQVKTQAHDAPAAASTPNYSSLLNGGVDLTA